MLHFVEHLQHVPIFEGLTRGQLCTLASIAEEKRFQRGEILFNDGEDSTGFYVVLQGQIRVYKLSFDGKEQTLHVMGPNEPIGEAAVFAGEPFPAYAEATKNSALLFFPKNAFVQLLGEEPSFALGMLAVLSRRLVRFASLVEDLSLKEAPGRLAAYLLYQTRINNGDDVIHLDITKTQLANVLAMTPETLSRVLARLMHERILVETDSKRFRVLDRAQLVKLSTGETRLK